MRIRMARGVCAAAALGTLLLPGAARAQTPPETPPAVTPLAAPLDLGPLRKAFGALRGSPSLQAQTEMRMDIAGPGMTAVIRESIHVTLKRPNKFRSEVTLRKPDGGAGAKYTVVSDGAQVWTYRPGTKQYSVVSRAAFEKANDDFPVLGLFGSFHTNPMVEAIVTLPEGADQAFVAALKEDGSTFTGGPETVDGAELYAYTMVLTKEQITMRFFVEPRAARLARLEMKMKEGDLDIQMTETIRASSATPTLTAGTFQFTVPPGVQKVKKLSVEPF